MELSIENTIIFISKMCGCVDVWTHYNTLHVHTRHATYCFSNSSHHNYVRTSQQCFIVPISKPEEKLRKIKIHISTMKPH